jgi:hypothetical protein
MEPPLEADIPPVAFEVHKQKKQKTEKDCSSSQAGAALPPAEENLPPCALGVQFFGGSLGHLSGATGSTAGAAQPSLQEADAPRLPCYVQTEDMNPAELFLEHVLRFWKRIGYFLSSDLTDVKYDQPDIDMVQFLQEPPLVRIALKVWLRDGADLPASAAIVPMLALWFCDPGNPDFDGEEAEKFLDQWQAYVKWYRCWKRHG